MSLSLLRNERYSGLEDLVAESAGYHIAPDGNVFSDRYSPEHLLKLRNEIYYEFYTPRQILRIAGKALRMRLLTRRLLGTLPSLLWHAAAGHFNPALASGQARSAGPS